MRAEGWVEGLCIALAWAVLLVSSRAFRLSFFGRGTIAAGFALGACWTIITSFMLIFGFVPALGLLVFILFPALEEAVRVYFVYTVLSKYAPKVRDYLSFAVGYASVEALYKICLSIWLPSWTGFDALGYLLTVAVSWSALLLFGIMMSTARALGLPGGAAFVLCAVLHSTHNIAVPSLLAGEYPVAVGLVTVSSYLILTGIAFQFLRTAERGASGAHTQTTPRNDYR